MNVTLKSYDTSSLEGKSSIVIAAGIPSVPRRASELSSQLPLPKPEPSATQRALIELRSLHGQKSALDLYHLKRSHTTAGGRVRQGSKQSDRGRNAFKTGLLRDSARNQNSNDTVKHLMHQLSELNNISYERIVKGGGSESFCSEMTLQSRRDDGFLDTKGPIAQVKPDGGAGNPRSHNVMKLIERQILRDLTRHINRSNKDSKGSKSDERSDIKTHSDELPGGMKVVIKKTTRRDEGKGSKSGDVTKSRMNDAIVLPSITKTAPASMRRRRHEKYEWSMDEAKSSNKMTLPTMAGVAIQGQSAPQEEPPSDTTPRRQKSHSHTHGDGMHPSLPKIQEEPDNYTKDNDDIKRTRDVATNVSPIATKDPSPTSESPESAKVKLPILGKSIGQQKEANYENGSKFIKPSIGEIKRIIHGLYGDYFDFTLDRYYTYEKQLNESKHGVTEAEKPVHYVTPALDDSKTPAASHTLQLFKSASKRSDDSHVKTQAHKISAPLIRSKYGKAIAAINKGADKVPERSQDVAQVTDRLSYSQPLPNTDSRLGGEMDYVTFLREQIPYSGTPNTPNEKVLRNHIAYQVALYHEQIARENRSLQQTNYTGQRENRGGDYRQILEDGDYKTSITQFTDDIDRYAEYLEAYLETKRKHSQERKAKLRELRQKQKSKRQEKNKHLEVVENRDAFLAQVAISNIHPDPKATSKTPANTVQDDNPAEAKYDFVHEETLCETTLIAKTRAQDEAEKLADAKQKDKQAMGTKIYRIFGERKKSASAIRRWVAQAPLPYTSRAIKRQVTRSSKGAHKTTILPQTKSVRHQIPSRPRLMTDLVSRFQISTRYKLDRKYVASLASGTL